MADGAGRVVRLRGTGRVDVPAYGIADAEHLVEKELSRAWPDARVEILQVGRSEGEGRIVEGFAVSYRIRAEVVAGGPASEAFRIARAKLEGTRYGRTEWEEGEG